MPTKQEFREKRRRAAQRNRYIAIGVIVLGVLLLVAAFVLPPILKPENVGVVKAITPAADKSQGHGTTLGNSAAPVKLDVWEDFQCSGCLSYSTQLEPQILQAYVDTGKVFYTFHFMPFIDGGQGESHDAANAAMCAADQDRFWDYHDMLFANWLGENAGSYTRPRLVAFAKQLGLDMTAFNQCFDSNKFAAVIQQDVDAGSKRGVPPTPGIFVNDKMVVSSAGANYLPSFDDISKAIEAAGGK